MLLHLARSSVLRESRTSGVMSGDKDEAAAPMVVGREKTLVRSCIPGHFPQVVRCEGASVFLILSFGGSGMFLSHINFTYEFVYHKGRYTNLVTRLKFKPTAMTGSAGDTDKQTIPMEEGYAVFSAYLPILFVIVIVLMMQLNCYIERLRFPAPPQQRDSFR